MIYYIRMTKTNTLSCIMMSCRARRWKEREQLQIHRVQSSVELKYPHTHICTHMQTQTHTQTHTDTHTNTHTHTCTCTHRHTRTHRHAHTHTHTHTHIHTHIPTHTHTYPHTRYSTDEFQPQPGKDNYINPYNYVQSYTQ